MKAIAAFLVLGVALPVAAQNRPRIAVVPLKARRIQKDKDIVSIMDALLVSQVSNLAQYDVISASDIQAMLKAEGMKDALGCDAVTCAAEIGRALDARSTLTGTVGKLGDTIVINLTMFDNEKMTALWRANIEVKNDEDLFAGAVRAVVVQLFGAQSSAPSAFSGNRASASEIFQEPGTLNVTSKPEGAQDGRGAPARSDRGFERAGRLQAPVHLAQHGPPQARPSSTRTTCPLTTSASVQQLPCECQRSLWSLGPAHS